MLREKVFVRGVNNTQMKKLSNKGLSSSFVLAGSSVGMGIVGDALNSPGLISAGQATSNFIPVAAKIVVQVQL